jgi:hypothetical protein
MVFGCDGKTCLPVFVFWKSNPLTDAQQGLLASMLCAMIEQDPDLDVASTSILDFSMPRGTTQRCLREIALSDLPQISVQDRDEMLSIFAAGFEMATVQLDSRGAKNERARNRQSFDDDHPDLFA